MEDDDSSIELVYEENLSPPKVKEEVEGEAAEEEECFVIVEKDNNESFNEDKDPMDLLELLEKKSPEETLTSKGASENGDESESVASSGAEDLLKRRLMSEYSWCFGDTEKNCVWCLYCNVVLKYPATNSLAKHQQSLTHRERKETYLDFLNQLNKDTYRLSSNRDFKGDVKEAKNHRQSLDEDFANYQWDKWEEEHDWLVRTDVRYTGYCKYCHMKTSVANGYFRKQHEDGTRHKDFKRKAPKRRATVCGDLQSFLAKNLTPEPESQETVSAAMTDGESYGKWYEKSKSSSDLCRCKLCDITMFESSFLRHIESNLHRQNLSALANPGVSDKMVKPDWETIQKDHEWLMEDPSDPMEAYCKYCKKRLGYGSSAAKRLIHEHSQVHRAAVQNFNNLASQGEDSSEVKDGEEKDENSSIAEEDQNEKSPSEYSNETEESQKKKRKRRKRKNVTDRYPWAKSYKKDSRFIICHYCKVLLRRDSFSGIKHEKSTRHQNAEKLYLEKHGPKVTLPNLSEKPIRSNETYYPWLVKFKSGVDYVLCKYCNFRFSRKANRLLHQNTKRHQEAEKALLQETTKNDSKTPIKTPQRNVNDSREGKSPMASQEAELKLRNEIKMSEWQKRFEWIRSDKGLLFNYGFCVYCDKNVFLPSPGFASKHQRSSPHIRARMDMKRKGKLEESLKQTEGSEETASEHSSNSRAGPAAKRYKASSLQTAIETAKRLTAAHLEMMSFMHNNGQQKTDIVQKFQMMTTVQDNTNVKNMPPPPSSPSVESIIATPTSRDPFDLFFNSISETLKRLPADLASEGKLKCMQIIFDLEIRAQQRQSQVEVISTPNTTLNGSFTNTINNNSLIDLEMPTETALPAETSMNDEIKQQQPNQRQQNQQQRPQLTYQQHQQQHQHQQQTPRPRSYFNVQNTTQNRSLLQQQLLQPHQPPPPTQKPRNYNVQAQSNSSFQKGSPMMSSPSPSKLTPQRQRDMNLGMGQPQRDMSQHSPNTFNQHRGINKNSLINMNQRSNVSTSNSFVTGASASTPTSTSTLSRLLNHNPDSLINNTGNNGHSPSNKIPMIRPVPLSSLTVKKYPSNEEPAIHHIQLNSRTQSKIIPLDTNSIRR